MRGSIAAYSCLFAALAIDGCSRPEPEMTDHTAAEWVEDDRIVLKSVLEDLLTYKDFRTYPSWASRPKLVVWDETEGLSWYITTGQLSQELKDLPPVSTDLYNALKLRNSRKITLGAVESRNVVKGQPRDFAKHERFDDDFERKHPDARAYVGFWLPAYSTDCRAALVRFSFGPTAHGACGTCFLEKLDGVWKVKWRKLSYFA